MPSGRTIPLVSSHDIPRNAEILRRKMWCCGAETPSNADRGKQVRQGKHARLAKGIALFAQILVAGSNHTDDGNRANQHGNAQENHDDGSPTGPAMRILSVAVHLVKQLAWRTCGESQEVVSKTHWRASSSRLQSL